MTGLPAAATLLLLGAGFGNRSDKRIVRSSLGNSRRAIPGTAPGEGGCVVLRGHQRRGPAVPRRVAAASCSRNARSSSSRRDSGPRKAHSRIWRRGSRWGAEPKVQSLKPKVRRQEPEVRIQNPATRNTHHAPRLTPPPPLNPSSILPGKSCRTKPGCRTRMSSANAWKRSSPSRNTQHATRRTCPSSSPASPPCSSARFPAGTVRERTRTLTRGDRVDPLDLVEWLEEQGYEPEAQVTQKGEIALRGGILDLYPLTSPWPVRLEFFGDELESLRQFDPLTQISREEITAVTIPPAGELGLLEEVRSPKSGAQSPESGDAAGLSAGGNGFPAVRAGAIGRAGRRVCPASSRRGPLLHSVGNVSRASRGARDDPPGSERSRAGLVALGGDGAAETSSDAPFPLTPALSLGEREKPRQPETNSSAVEHTQMCASCPLSLRERVRVRGKAMS